jgi:hypothetical protein
LKDLFQLDRAIVNNEERQCYDSFQPETWFLHLKSLRFVGCTFNSYFLEYFLNYRSNDLEQLIFNDSRIISTFSESTQQNLLKQIKHVKIDGFSLISELIHIVAPKIEKLTFVNIDSISFLQLIQKTIIFKN